MQNAVTVATIEAKIMEQEFINPATIPHMTLCVLKLANDFAVVGISAPADPTNFNAELGRDLARADAIRQVWRLEGYLLREQLSQLGGRIDR